ncbi:hypothetical protein NRY95_05415 [Xanthomonas campestris pv. phormiicola]|nr:hypothetical protein [Xanthomonas campestris pv. phormiicola]UYC17402.1 hypothetical protein NRY95_05415 [Xanthomonas campestris pv. phormiicola]
MSQIRIVSTVIAGIVGLTIAHNASACCPDIGHGPVASTGLGESAPKAANLSTVADVRIYEFMRDGVTYLQINDATGGVRGAVGRIDSTAWVMPIGSDADRVSILRSTGSVQGEKVYEAEKISVYLQETSNSRAWIIVTKD